jgi:trimeric autotransporter adhesin
MRRLAYVVVLSGCHGVFDLDTVSVPPPDTLVDTEKPDPDAADDHLVARFDFENNYKNTVDGTGADCADVCPPFGTGKHAIGVDFNGASHCLSVKLTPPDAFTVVAWVYRSTDTSTSVIAKPLSAAYDSWQIDTDNSGVGRFVTFDGLNENFVTGQGVTAASWHHVAVTYQSGTKRLYVDGASVGAATNTSIVSGIEPMLIGCDKDFGSYSRYFAGSLDDVRVYNVELASSEINTLSTM